MLLLMIAMLAAPEAASGTASSSLSYGASSSASTSLPYGMPKATSTPTGYGKMSGYGAHLAGYGAAGVDQPSAAASLHYLPKDAPQASSLEVLAPTRPVVERLVSDKAGVVWAYMPSMGMYRNVKTGSLRYGAPDLAPKKDYDK